MSWTTGGLCRFHARQQIEQASEINHVAAAHRHDGIGNLGARLRRDAVFVTRDSRWVLGIIPCFAVPVLVTPSDPGSMILAGVGLSILYVVGVVLSKLLLGGRHD
jgi:hypothetical protein